MATGTLLCIHRDPSQLNLLAENGYELATATTGFDGLQLFRSRPVDAVVLEYHLGVLDGAAIADEIKRIRPEVPIVMVVDHVELPGDALKSVDALVVKSDGPHFLLATVLFVLNVRPTLRQTNNLGPPVPADLRGGGGSGEVSDRGQSKTVRLTVDGHDAPFSREVWRRIRAGNIQF